MSLWRRSSPISSRQMLLLLDNAEHLLAARGW
jgi:hypothetical protein